MSDRKLFNKLVRDKIPELLQKAGAEPDFRVLNQEEYKLELNKKLKEECQEVIEAPDKISLTEELADLTEVILSLAKNSNITLEEIEKTRIKKKENRGGFDAKLFLESTEVVKI